ncbi:hypothetical protein AB0H83_41185 [Dactylosporangium sp. NPDC050688]|uniref:NucA/NucB deoxyribonuclease domain-containing protein n=1 Tax=Dactylosporangium sp. NPDC050688 TaxID=3157217 RepID=UPI0033FE78B0
MVGVAAAVAALLTGVGTAHAAPKRPTFAWVVTESSGGVPTPANAPPQTNSNSLRTNNQRTLVGTPQDDLKRTCRNEHFNQATTREGWMADRFNRCFTGHRKVTLYKLGGGPVPVMIAETEWDYTLVGLAQSANRIVDWYLTFDNWEERGGEERVTTPLKISLSGCTTTSVSCLPTSGAVERPLGNWRTDPQTQITMLSPNGTGVGDTFVIYNQIKLSMAITPSDPEITPWTENNMTSAEIRFDSAGSALASSANGTVFSDFSPTFDLAALARAANNTAGVQESIQHIDDALHHVDRTWPSFVGKAIPGEYKPELGSEQRPLRRMTGTDRIDKNRDRAKKVCVDVWGDGAATPNLNCDEYPFASTYEGAYWSTTEADGDTNGWMQWNGSARMIGEIDNQDAGNLYLNNRFYKANRILDNDKFFVAITN